MERKLFEIIASHVDARITCEKTGNEEWYRKHADMVDNLVREHMPSGSGFDNGTSLDWPVSTGERLVFCTSFHHMNDGGVYDGWTEHVVTVKPSLVFGIVLSISGRDRNGWKDFASEVFQDCLTQCFVPDCKAGDYKRVSTQAANAFEGGKGDMAAE